MVDAGVMVMEKAITALLWRPRGRGAAGGKGPTNGGGDGGSAYKEGVYGGDNGRVDRCRVMELRPSLA